MARMLQHQPVVVVLKTAAPFVVLGRARTMACLGGLAGEVVTTKVLIRRGAGET